AVARFDLLRPGTAAILRHGAVLAEHGEPSPSSASEQGRCTLGYRYYRDCVLRRWRVGLPAYPGSGELLHPRFAADRRAWPPGLLRCLRDDRDDHDQLRHAASAWSG